MATSVTEMLTASSKINRNGRVVIPAAIRRQMDLSAGDTLLFSVEGGALRVESQRMRIRRIQESLRQCIEPGRCLSDELIAERRDEARREMEEGLE